MVAWRICGSGVTCCLRVFWGLVRAGAPTTASAITATLSTTAATDGQNDNSGTPGTVRPLTRTVAPNA